MAKIWKPRNSDDENGIELRPRPKTRLGGSYIEEDLKAISEGLKDKAKGYKKILAKLQAEFGGSDSESSDDDIKYPRTEDEVRLKRFRPRGRGRGRGRWSQRAILRRKGLLSDTIPSFDESKSAPLPMNCSRLEYKDFFFQIGDILEAKNPPSGYKFARIVGFLQDQYSKIFVSVEYLHSQMDAPVLTNVSYFDAASMMNVQSHQPIEPLDSFVFYLRPPARYSKTSDYRPQEIITKEGRKFVDTPTLCLTSADHMWYQLIY